MKQQLKKQIGLRVRKIRKTLGYTQVQMVTFFDIGRANYSRIEKGEIFPTATILNVLHKEFNVSLDWLICNEGEMFASDRQKKIGLKSRQFGKHTEEVNELLFYMEKLPMLRYAVLSFFMEYKVKNHEIIQRILDGSSQPGQDVQEEG